MRVPELHRTRCSYCKTGSPCRFLALALLGGCFVSTTTAPPVAPPNRRPAGRAPIRRSAHTHRAQSVLIALAGTSAGPITVTFTQLDDEKTAVGAEMDDFPAGTFVLVVHDASECPRSPDAIGPALASAQDKIELVVRADHTTDFGHWVYLALHGEDSIVGHTAVLHESRKGVVGRALACGVITTPDY